MARSDRRRRTRSGDTAGNDSPPQRSQFRHKDMIHAAALLTVPFLSGIETGPRHHGDGLGSSPDIESRPTGMELRYAFTRLLDRRFL